MPPLKDELSKFQEQHSMDTHPAVAGQTYTNYDRLSLGQIMFTEAVKMFMFTVFFTMNIQPHRDQYTFKGLYFG